MCERERQTDRQTDRQTEGKEKDRERVNGGKKRVDYWETHLTANREKEKNAREEMSNEINNF